MTVDLSGTNDLGQSIAKDDGHQRRRLLRIHRPAPAPTTSSGSSRGSSATPQQRRQRGRTATANSFENIVLAGCTDGVNYNFGELQRSHCRLRDLAIHVGNTFFHPADLPAGSGSVREDLSEPGRQHRGRRGALGHVTVPEGHGHPLGPEAGDQADPDLPCQRIQGSSAAPGPARPREGRAGGRRERVE